MENLSYIGIALSALALLWVWKQGRRADHGEDSAALLAQLQHLELGLRAMEQGLRAQADQLAAAARQEAHAAQDRQLSAQQQQLALLEQKQQQIELAAQQRGEQLRLAVEQQLQRAQDEAKQHREEMNAGLHRFGSAQAEQLHQLATRIDERLKALSEQQGKVSEQLRTTVETRLQNLQADNNSKLEKMRETVDEKLHATLEKRLGESFHQVSEKLEQVHRGLGEMQQLASGVGDLKRVLTNVRTRGTFGEVQLGALLEQILAQEQYESNVATVPGSNERVEYAVKLPGQNEGEHIWLPIDAKFPVEDFHRLLDAQERMDVAGAETAAKDLERRIRDEAAKIRDKYISPPHTTDFAILFLPTENLYAEVLRRPGLQEALHRDCRINIAGPTTLAAILNSLQMGFRTLAIEKRSSEVWTVLGAVKSEFGKFGGILEKTRKKLDEASNNIGEIEKRSRAMTRKLKEVEALPAAQSQTLLGLAEDSDEDDSGES